MKECSVEKKLEKLFNELNVKLGFCLYPEDIKKITDKKYFTADEFVEEVFKAEGLDVNYNLNLTREVKRKFTDIFGNQISPTDYKNNLY